MKLSAWKKREKKKAGKAKMREKVGKSLENFCSVVSFSYLKSFDNFCDEI